MNKKASYKGAAACRVEADAAYQAANRLLPNALRALRQAAAPLGAMPSPTKIM